MSLENHLTPEQLAKTIKLLNDGEDLMLADYDLYGDIYSYYLNTGRMPYGTAKARTGDPGEWVYQAACADLQDLLD